MARQVNIDCPRFPVPFTYTGSSLYHCGSASDRGGFAVGQWQTGERDCRGLRTILHGDERAGEKKTLDCIVAALEHLKSPYRFMMALR